MAIFYPDILDQKTAPRTFSYGDKDVMLYALGVGMGRDQMNETELAFVYEKNLKVIPTAATVLAAGMRGAAGPAPEMPAGHRPSQINFLMVVHGEQKVELHKPLRASGTYTAQGRTVGAYDKGAGKGAVIYMETKTKLKDTGAPVSTSLSSIFARGDGGFGGPNGPAPAETHAIPDRKPDATCELATREDQALLYRLSGDRNPLHCDPDVATAAGFPKPILHGLCTYGVSCRAVLKTICDYDHTKITAFDARFSSPVYPGETVIVDMWVDGNVVSYRSRLKERDVMVINNGRCVLKD